MARLKPGYRLMRDEPLDVRAGGYRFRRLALHRHLPETAAVGNHAHAWAQVLVYLSGAGEQEVAGRSSLVGPGSVVAVPPRVAHGFRRAEGGAPLCWVLDLNLPRGRRVEPGVGRMTGGVWAAWRRDLAQAPAPGVEPVLGGAAALLRLAEAALRAAGWVAVPRDAAPALVLDLASQLARAPLDVPLAELVARSGFQRDHLNRKLRRETGLPLGQWRQQRRLERAEELLAAGWAVGRVAAEVGLPDQNYFARWFRRQTGRAPSVWARTAAEAVRNRGDFVRGGA